MKLKGKFKNLKTGAKRVFVGMLILCILSSATGIGSIFVYADEVDEALTNTNTNTDNNNTTIDEHIHTADEQWHSVASGHWHECTAGDGEKMDFSEHSLNWVAESETTEVEKCSVCGYVNDTRTAESEPVVTEPDTVDVAHIHTIESYTSIDAMNHEGTCTDPNCGQTITAAHNMGDWKKTPDGTQHTRTCLLCDYTETHTPDYDDQGVCTICGLTEETNTDTSSTDSIELPKRRSLKSVLRLTSANSSSIDDDIFAAFFGDDIPTAYTGLEYNGELQVLVEKKVPSVYEYTVDDVTYKYYTTIVEVDGETCPGDITAKDAGTHTVNYVLKCDKYNADGLNIGEYNATKVFTVEIAPLSIDNVDCAINDGYKATTAGKIDYLSATDYAEAVTLTYTSAVSKIKSTLTNGTDYSVTNPTIDEIPSFPTDGESKDYDLTINGLGNFTGTKTLKIEAKPATLLFDGIEQIADKYLDFVEIAADGCLIGLAESGSFDGTVCYDTIGSDQEISVYLKKSGVNRIIKQTVSGITVTNDTTDDEIWAGFFAGSGDISYPPEAATGLVYNGQSQSLIKNYQPTKNSFVGLNNTTKFTYKDSLVYCDNEQCSSIDAPKTDAGTYYIRYVLEYYKGEDQDTIYTAEKKFSVTIASLDISDCTILVDNSYSIDGTSDSGRIDYLKTDDYAGAIILRYIHDSEIHTLTKDVDYTVAVPTISDIPEADGTNKYYLTITGKGSVTGTNYQSVCIEVPKITLTFNNGDLADYYIEYVNVGVKENGYVVGLSQASDFATTQKYKGEGEKQTVVFYVKEQNGTNVAKRTASNLTIRYPHLLFDSKETQNPFYVDCVVLSANNFAVYQIIESDGTTSTNETAKYTRYTEGLNQSFTLVFKDADSLAYADEIKIKVENLNIYKNIDIEIKYNGGDYQQWFNKDVTITAKGYKISDPDVGAYKSSYTFTETGENVKSLSFQKTDSSDAPESYTIIVRIDRTAPTGSITLKDATSKTFTTKDSVVGYVNSNQSATITSEDELSGADKILYYVSDTFYNSSEELTASMSEKNAKWRTYSSSSKPTTVKDKNNYIYAAVYDKAGNATYLSLGNIVYDTVAPTVTTATVTDSADGKSKVLVVAGTDELSGINRFKLMYFEKDNTHQPSKEEIFNMGTYIEASSSSGKEAGATYTISGLESGKTYMFYVASVDRAGNISDVKAIEGEGTTAAEAAAAKAAADAAAAQAAASSALAAAPNGLAGGNSGQPTTSPEASAGSQSGTSGEEEGEEERVISRDPYIAEATGSTQIGPINTSGWDKIKGEIRKADNGTQMSVEMSGVSEIPLSVLQEVADRDDLEVTFLINDGVEWTIKGSSITDEGIKSVDLGVKMGSKNIPAKVSSDVVGSYQHVDFAVNEEGELGFTATISVPVGTSNAGMNATLYYYNPEKNELEAQKASVVDDSGRAKFDMTHCSDYTIVITPEKLLSDSEVSYSVTRSDTLTSEEIFDGTKIRLADLFGVSGGGRIWLFVIAAISAALCVAILYFPGLQKEECN